MEIQYLEHDRRHYAACRNVPVFHISPHSDIYRAVQPLRRAQPQPILGPMPAPTITNPRVIDGIPVLPIKWGDRCRLISQQEKDWRDLKPNEKFKPVSQHGFVLPISRVKPWLPDSFAVREAEYEWLVKTQDIVEMDPDGNTALDKDGLPIILRTNDIFFEQDVFHTNNIQHLNLSSSYEDDDETHGERILVQPEPDHDYIDVEAHALSPEHHDTRRYGAVFTYGQGLTAEDAAPLMRRIDWERWVAKHGQVDAVRLTAQGDNVFPVSRWPMDKAILQELGQRIYEALGSPSVEAIATMERERFHYGFTGSFLYGITKGEAEPEQPQEDNLLLLAQELEQEDEVLQGPQELGLHNFTDDENPLQLRIDESLVKRIHRGRVTSEPSPDEEERWAHDYPPVLYGSRPHREWVL